ncbi:unnamed protein product [Ambrosiozyma monospora]|uniref:Unnamed protein product n=1 Tax=Ambrosiozyma monospora TaxID=43982 RepID=A0A9W6YS91_AMBMO|nr:unnamed protein product [Ambrosiozyma monospora]
MVVQILRFSDDPVAPGLTAACACFQATDGMVQTIIFAYKEKPWRLVKSRIKRDHFVELPDDYNSQGSDDDSSSSSSSSSSRRRNSSNHINMSYINSLNNNRNRQPQKYNTVDSNNMDSDYRYNNHYNYNSNDYSYTDTQSTKPFAKQDNPIPRSMNLPQIKFTTTNQTTESTSLSSDLLHIQNEIPKAPAELDVIRLVSGNSDYAMNSISNPDTNHTNHANNNKTSSYNHGHPHVQSHAQGQGQCQSQGEDQDQDQDHGDNDTNGQFLKPPTATASQLSIGLKSKFSMGLRSTDEVDLFQALSSPQSISGHGHHGPK